MHHVPHVTVVITAHNERAGIADCLRSIAAQDGVRPDAVEIVLVDDRSSDGTADVAAEICPGARIVRISRPGPSNLTPRQNALDHGFRAAKSSFVFVTDADAIVSRDWIRSGLDRLESAQADIAAGPVRYCGGSALLAAMQTVDSAWYIAWCELLNALGCSSGVLFGNLAFRRDVYEQLGGFTEIGFALTEDLSFARAAHRAGFCLAFESLPMVSVGGSPTWSHLLLRLRRTTRGGVSALSVSLGVWMFALLAPAALLLAGYSWALTPLVLRYAAGTAAVAGALGRARLLPLLPWALAYEPLAICVGARVLLDRMMGRPVEWGGVNYSESPTTAGGRFAPIGRPETDGSESGSSNDASC